MAETDSFNRLQLQWLRRQLEQAARDSNPVAIVAHVPPGYFERDPFGPFFDTGPGDQGSMLKNSHFSRLAARSRV
jgi:hypothetical protein